MYLNNVLFFARRRIDAFLISPKFSYSKTFIAAPIDVDLQKKNLGVFTV